MKKPLKMHFYSYYGFHFRGASGKRSAAMIAAQRFNKKNADYTIYIASKEARTLTKITPNNTSKYFLHAFSETEVTEFEKNYLNFKKEFPIGKYFDKEKELNMYTCILRVIYEPTEHALALPENELKLLEGNRVLTQKNWITISSQAIIPNREYFDISPLECKLIYSSEEKNKEV